VPFTGKGDPASGAIKEWALKKLFEMLDALSKCCGRQVNLLGGLSEVEVLGTC
jgi:hypothetical protein